MTNMARWGDMSSLQREWSERARFAARFIAPGQVILDLGCGAMDLERFANAADYLPLDLAARDARTRIADLNSVPIPADLLQQADLVTLLGVVEYLDNVPGLFRQIAAAGKPLLFTYCTTERHVEVDRGAHDWVNAFSTADLLAMLDEAAMEATRSYVFNGTQSLLIAQPKGTSPTRHQVARRPSLVVVGHYGRGNCGDEALLQCVYEAFRDTHEVIVSVDEHGAFDGFWNWYPYNACRLINRSEAALLHFDPSLVGVIVGGGGLPLGCAANQVVEARLAGKRAVLAGIDAWMAEDTSWIAAYAQFFDLVAFRTAEAYAHAGGLLGGVEAIHGGDWALLLPTDSAIDVVPDPRRVLVTLREFDLKTVLHTYGESVKTLLEDVRARGLVPAFLPFCPEDERFIGELGLDRAAPVERHWWNPRRMKQVIAASGMMLSVGRLHPMVFAASVGIPVACILPSFHIKGGEGSLPKLKAMAAELGIAVVTLSGGLANFLQVPTPADPEKVAAATERARAMIARLKQVFAAERRPPSRRELTPSELNG